MKNTLFVFVATLFAVTACSDKPPGCVEKGLVQVLTQAGEKKAGEYSDPIRELCRLDTSTFIETLEVRARDDGMVFACTGVQGLHIIDATDVEAMDTQWRLTGSLGHNRFPRCQHVTWSGDRVYLSSRGDEVQPIPFIAGYTLGRTQATPIGEYTDEGVSFEGMAASGDHIFVAAHDDGLLILEQREDTIALRSQLGGFTNAWAVAVQDTTLYVADGSGGLAIVDVSDLDAPHEVGRVATLGSAQSVEVEGSVAVVATGSAGVVTVDVSDPAAPRLMGRVDTPGTALQVSLDGRGFAFVADWNDFRVIDIRDPENPRAAASKRVEVDRGFSRVLGVGARNGVAFVGEWTGIYSFRFDPGKSAPDIRILNDELTFGTTQDAENIVLENEGSAPLLVCEVNAEGAGFSVPDEGVWIEPGEREVVELVFSPPHEQELSGRVSLRTDDPDEPLVHVGLRGNVEGSAVGELAPEVEVNVLNGDTFRLSEHRGEVVVLSYFATF